MERKRWHNQLDIIVNGVETPLGRAFDIGLIFSIFLSSSLLILSTVQSLYIPYSAVFIVFERIFLVIFTLEYSLRIIVSRDKRRYLLGFYGLVDFFSIVPMYFALFIPGSHLFPIIRILRLLRLFSVFKLGRYVSASRSLLIALKASGTKIVVFVIVILFLVVVVGTLMYVIEGPQNGFANIPEAMYWAVVTISTVGYGDISPQTPFGKTVASALMIIGYGIIAVPTGIITSEIVKETKTSKNKKSCIHCGEDKHPKDAHYCHQCGEAL